MQQQQHKLLYSWRMVLLSQLRPLNEIHQLQHPRSARNTKISHVQPGIDCLTTLLERVQIFINFLFNATDRSIEFFELNVRASTASEFKQA